MFVILLASEITLRKIMVFVFSIKFLNKTCFLPFIALKHERERESDREREIERKKERKKEKRKKERPVLK